MKMSTLTCCGAESHVAIQGIIKLNIWECFSELKNLQKRKKSWQIYSVEISPWRRYVIVVFLILSEIVYVCSIVQFHDILAFRISIMQYKIIFKSLKEQKLKLLK